MARDKSKDDTLFNCGQKHEHDYVAGLYTDKQQPSVRQLLKDACEDKRISHSKHKEVYALIKDELGYTIPD